MRVRVLWHLYIPPMRKMLAAIGAVCVVVVPFGQPSSAAAASCSYTFTAPNGAPTLRTAAGSPIALSYRFGDNAYSTYDGVGGILLTVWGGMQDSVIASRAQQMENGFPSQAQQSFDESTSVPLADDETNQVDEPTSLSLVTLAPFAVMVTKSGSQLTEYSVADSTEVWAADQVSGVCVSGNASASRQVSTPAGASFEFPARSASTAPSQQALPTLPKSVVRYRTFIGPSSVSFPPALCGWNLGGRFAGDGRGFSTSYTASNRTRASVFFDWSKRIVSTSKHVGMTKRLDSNGNVIEQKRASQAGIKFISPVMSSSYGRIEISHSVANPLCWSAGPISYAVVIERWQTGGTRISGRLLRVPHHEAIVFPIGGSTGSYVFTRSAFAFHCLSVNCGALEPIRVSTGT